ncbi:MAG: thioredoxin domain-containing protein [Chloroflexi bacterium]|nr:thioredoxin domain-containing protein [Chloroflexota bacterium]
MRELDPFVSSGAVRVVSRHFTVLGEASQRAAEAVECAGDQRRHHDYRERLYATDPSLRAERFSAENLKKYAAELGLTAEPFNRCLDSGTYRARVAADMAEGRRKGVDSTPTLFVNDEKIAGVPAAGQLTATVERVRPAK